MRFVWESPGRLLLVFAVVVHGVTIRLSCNECGGLALASITMWAGDPPASGTRHQCWVHSPPWTTQFLLLHCPSSRCLLSHRCSGDTRNAESILKPSRLVTDSPAMEVTLLEIELQMSSQIICVISLAHKGSEFSNILSSRKTSIGARTMPCLGGALVSGSDRHFGIEFSTKYSGGFGQGVAGKEIRNKEQAHIQSTSLQL